jgi:hypothetical protein
MCRLNGTEDKGSETLAGSLGAFSISAAAIPRLYLLAMSNTLASFRQALYYAWTIVPLSAGSSSGNWRDRQVFYWRFWPRFYGKQNLVPFSGLCLQIDGTLLVVSSLLKIMHMGISPNRISLSYCAA